MKSKSRLNISLSVIRPFEETCSYNRFLFHLFPQSALDCDLTQPAAAQQCFGAHGRPLIFHLPANTTIKISLRKEDKIILRLNGNKLINASDICKDIQIFPENVTFKIDMVTTAHSGDYNLEIHSSASGATLKTVKIHLDILGKKHFFLLFKRKNT